MLSSVSCLALPYFSALSHKRNDLDQKKLLNINMYFDFPYSSCPKLFLFQEMLNTFLIPRNVEQYIIINVHYIGVHVKETLFLSGFNET
jgi:hypothetical protein